MSREQVQAPDFLDMIAFYLALGSVDKALVGLDAQAASEGTTTLDRERLSRHRDEAGVLVRRISGSVDSGIDSILREAAEKAKLRVKTKIDAALRGSPVTNYTARIEFLESFLPRMKSHSNVLRDVFSDSFSSAIRVVQASEVEAPESRLFKLAGIRMASGGKLSLLKKWTQEATEICGNPVSEIEEVAVDVASTDAILDKVNLNNRKLETLDATDPVAALVQEENANLLSKIDRVAERSKDSTAVKAHAASRMAKSGPAEAKNGSATAISAHLRMTPEQEDAMLVRGKAVIAAGAGSGKTRVLAGKVVHHLQDLGLSMGNVMAVSFTIKSSTELKERILKYGQEIGFNLPDASTNWEAYAGIGTTHSIARGILKGSKSGWKVNPKTDTIKGSEIPKLLKVAIAQVKMRPAGGGSPPVPPDALSFFPNLSRATPKLPRPLPSPVEERPEEEGSEALPDGENAPLEDVSPIQNPVESPSPLDFYLSDEGRYQTVLAAALDTLKDFLSAFPSVRTFPKSPSGWTRVEVFGPGISRFWNDLSGLKVDGIALVYKEADPKYRSPERFVGFGRRDFDRASAIEQIERALGVPQAKAAMEALKGFAMKKPEDLDPNEKEIFESIVTNPLVASGLKARNVLMKTGALVVTASEEEETPVSDVDVSETGIESASRRKLRNLDFEGSPYYFYLHNPANQWFNLGAKDEDFQTEDAKGQKKEIPIGEFARYLGFHKNSLTAPGKLFEESEVASAFEGMGEEEPEVGPGAASGSKRIFSAVYGAYEWLKKNIPQMKGRLDYDDQLVQASRELIENPSLLAKYQKQYKCVLVDEAQDLNAAQHLMFGLVAGYIDPSTLQPRADGKISADTFALIGDDKQAIYEFRAADPSKFIEKSDLVPGGEGFATKLLDTNFRSGNVIVEAANKLIAYNSKQIPMVCKTDPARGEGSISRVEVNDYDAAAEKMAAQILSEFEEAKADGHSDKFFGRYGLAVRTNKEVYTFAMKMIEKGIPFRSKKNFLAGPAIGPVIGIFQILRKDNVQARNEGVIAGLQAPDFGINGRTVRGKLEELGVQDFYEFLVKDRGATSVYSYRKMSDRLQDYADYIEEVVRVGETGSATDVIDLILNTKGPDGDTFVDSLSAAVMEDAEAMEEIKLKATADSADGKVTAEMLADYALAPINPLRKAAQRFPTAAEFVTFIKGLIEANDKNVDEGEMKDAVQVDTVHGWKGLEVANLYVPMAQGVFPHRFSVTNEKLLASERRLAYVALTRGRNRVVVLEPKTELTGKPVKPSQFTFEACVPLEGSSKEGVEALADSSVNLMESFRLPVREEPAEALPKSPGEVEESFSVGGGPVDELEAAWMEEG